MNFVKKAILNGKRNKALKACISDYGCDTGVDRGADCNGHLI
jgi:hypothetical protein